MQLNSAKITIRGRLKQVLVAFKNHIEVNVATAYKSTLNVLMLNNKNCNVHDALWNE